MKIQCLYCKNSFLYLRKQKGTTDICPSCYCNRHRWHLKNFMIQYKGGGCQVCGYNKCQRSLDFHHMDHTRKDFNFGGKHCIAWKKIREELDKCICLCKNCHGEVHEGIDQLIWGHPETELLQEIRRIHSNWIAPKCKPYTRKGWEEFHPASIRIKKCNL